MAERRVLNTLSKVTAHVPDLVIYGNLMNKTPCIQTFNGVLLFADISGFTALTEKFSSANKKGNGADELTRTLNSYMGDIVDHVLVAGGDILNFAGDALLALWKVRRDQLSEVITLAVQCSMNIQETCAIRDTPVGVELRVKIAISAGRLSQIVVRNRTQEFFVVVGRAVDDVRLAEGLAKASSIILSPNAWDLCDRNNIVTERILNERAVKLLYIKRKTSFDLEAHLQDYGSHLEHEPNAHESIRKASLLSPDPTLEHNLRKYVMETVLRKLDDDQPLEYLSEMRPVTVLFLNLQFHESAPIELLCKAIQDATMGILQQITYYRGRINKIFAFDKGCTFLCIFGLPGDKQEDEAAHALHSAFNIHSLCSESIAAISFASIGVTSGPIYCGVVGHAARHEYTVFGRKVNLAARMMMHYPGLVSCDQETYQDSKLPAYLFSELPPKEMKGVINPGTLYQYLGSKKETTIGKAYMKTQRDEKRPLLGREMEIGLFRSTINGFTLCRDRRWQDCQRVLIYEGARGFGKSQILAEINYLAQSDGYRIIALELSRMNRRQPLYTMQNLMAIFLRIDTCKGFAEREKVLLSKISKNEDMKNLCLVNNIFLVKFPMTEEVSLMDQDVKHKEMEKLMIRLLQQAAEKETVVCIIDDAQYIDAESWGFLSEVTDSVPLFLVMALCPFRHEKQMSRAATHMLGSPNIVYVYLKELDPSVIPHIACHSLGVISMPSELQMLVIQRSHGVPYYLNELLKSLCSNKILLLEPVEKDDGDGMGNLLKQAKSHSHVHRSLSRWMNARKVMPMVQEQTEEDRILSCKLNEAVNLQNIPLPYPLKGIALSQLDNMTAAQQLVVKCAAVIGQKFSIILLNHILPEGAQSKFSVTINSLVKSRILECATKNDGRDRSQTLAHTPVCYCPPEAPQEGEKGKIFPSTGWAPWWAFGHPLEQWPCRVMRFCTPLLQETSYELWLWEQSRSLHHQCAIFLQPHAHRCQQCGGGSFIYRHSLAQSLNEESADTSLDGPDNVQPMAPPIPEDVLSVPGAVHHHGLKTSEESPIVSDNRTLRPPDDIFPSTSTAVTLPLSELSLEIKPPSTTSYKKRIFKSGLHKCNKAASETSQPREELMFLQRMDSFLQKLQTGESPTLVGCSCYKILEAVVSPLTHHWMEVGNRAKTMYYLLEAAAAAIHISNNYLALSFLNKAETLLTDKKKPQKTEELDENLKQEISRFELACMYSMKGEVLFNLGQNKNAEILLRKSLGLLHSRFPCSVPGVAVKLLVENAKTGLNHIHHHQVQEMLPADLPIVTEQIRCLSLLWQIYIVCGGTRGRVRARLAAKMEVRCAESTRDQSKIIEAYADYFQCCQRLRRRRSCQHFAALSLQLSSRLVPSIQTLNIILHLSLALSHFKLCFGHLSDAIEFGRRTQTLAFLLDKTMTEYRILPILIKILFLSNRYRELVSIVRRMESLINVYGMVKVQAWFYIICLDILLEGGFAIRRMDDCLEFMDNFHTYSAISMENQIKLNLFSSLALWFCRLQQWDLFQDFFQTAKTLLPQTGSSFFTLCGFSKLLECQVLLLRKAVAERSEDWDIVGDNTDQLMKIFKSRCETAPVFLSRLYHLEAYVMLLYGYKERAHAYLQKATGCAIDHENKLEESWIIVNTDCWFGDVTQDLWLEAAAEMPLWEDVDGTDTEILTRRKFLLKPLPVPEAPGKAEAMPDQETDIEG
ncbi:adenylate cyclase type 10 [Dendropsophus ebraccatus]|uniref:adenylate cyclase type 10 n=1 Tax=Dendropsophus ebraccatus TaxID=150705 RepID=UPI003831434C